MKVSASIIGDISLDVVTRLDNADLEEQADLEHIPNSVSILAGGTGTMFALATRRLNFGMVHLLGKVGADPYHQQSPDIAARFILQELEGHQVKVVASLDVERSTGVVMITYLPQNKRVLVVDAGANSTFSKTDLSPSMCDIVASSDILLVSGYTLLSPSRAAAVAPLMRVAYQSGRIVVLDVVPHEIHRMLDATTFSDLTTHVRVLVSNVHTVKHLLFPNNSNLPQGSELLELVASKLLERHNTVILRPDINYQCMLDRQGVIEEGPTGYADVPAESRRGYSELLTVRLLKDHYSRITSTLLGGDG